MSGSFRTLEFKVGFKYEPNAMQETRTFQVEAAAYAFAISVEQEGGVAVVMPGYKDEVPKSSQPLSF